LSGVNQDVLAVVLELFDNAAQPDDFGSGPENREYSHLVRAHA
jgi:hypothetical protein